MLINSNRRGLQPYTRSRISRVWVRCSTTYRCPCLCLWPWRCSCMFAVNLSCFSFMRYFIYWYNFFSIYSSFFLNSFYLLTHYVIMILLFDYFFHICKGTCARGHRLLFGGCTAVLSCFDIFVSYRMLLKVFIARYTCF